MSKEPEEFEEALGGVGSGTVGSAVWWQDVEGMMEVGGIPVKLGHSGLAESYDSWSPALVTEAA